MRVHLKPPRRVGVHAEAQPSAALLHGHQRGPVSVTKADVATFHEEGGSWRFYVGTGSMVQVMARDSPLPASDVAASPDEESANQCWV